MTVLDQVRSLARRPLYDDETRVTKLTPKEVYNRLKYAEAMKKKVAAVKKKIHKAECELARLEESCKHYHSSYKNHGSTGSWDREDHFWRIYECEDCGARWETDQSYELYKKYPYAVDKTYER